MPSAHEAAAEGFLISTKSDPINYLRILWSVNVGYKATNLSLIIVLIMLLMCYRDFKNPLHTASLMLTHIRFTIEAKITQMTLLRSLLSLNFLKSMLSIGQNLIFIQDYSSFIHWTLNEHSKNKCFIVSTWDPHRGQRSSANTHVHLSLIFVCSCLATN